MRELRVELARLNHQVSGRIDLRDIDLDCFDLISQAGGISPTALARAAGLHPATLTGVLDRLETGGWIVRERDPADRRAVVIRSVPARIGELLGHYAGMTRAMDEVTAGYTDQELALIVDFLRKASEAGRGAADGLA
ncbi:MAG: MarR family transcriptional regulator [Pseudolysinimonas sp.]